MSRFEAKLVLHEPIATLSGIPEQGPDVPEDERIKPGDAVVLVGQENAAMNGPWFISEGPWSRSLEDVEEAVGRSVVDQARAALPEEK